MKTRIEKVGSLIYGAQRLNGASASLVQWFAEENAGIAPDLTVALPGQSAAITFFERTQTSPELRLEFLRIADAIVSLERASQEVADNDTVELDVYLANGRELHFALAQFIENIGYPGIPPAFLRQHGMSICGGHPAGIAPSHRHY